MVAGPGEPSNTAAAMLNVTRDSVKALIIKKKWLESGGIYHKISGKLSVIIQIMQLRARG